MIVEISKQELASNFFSQSLAQSALARAYLLTGKALPDKDNLAKILAMALNCKLNASQSQAYGQPCGECQNCKWIGDNTHPKTPIYLRPDPESHKNNIKIEQIKELQSELSQSSEYFRVIVIEDASSQVLNRHAAAALLKTIEEARANTLFILCAESRDTVLPTIISRSQVIPFNNTEITEFSESAQELFDELKNWLRSQAAGSRLEQLLEAERLSQAETVDLIQILQLLQNQYSSNLVDFEQARLVLTIEEAINDLRNFVRPKAVFEDLLQKSL